MRILIVSATFAEVNGLLNSELSPVVNGESYSACFDRPETDLLVTGVGSVATAFHLGRALTRKEYDLVLNIGLAGSFDREITLGEVFNISCDEFADLGAENKNEFLDLFMLKLADENELPFQNAKLYPLKSAEDFKSGLSSVKAITVNKVHGNEDSISAVRNRIDASLESMEGAAVFYACNLCNVPSLQIRAVSNYVEPRNREIWQIGLALQNLWRAVSVLLKE